MSNCHSFIPFLILRFSDTGKVEWILPLHLRSLRTNKCHPGAQKEILDCPMSESTPEAKYTTLIMGDLLAFLINGGGGIEGSIMMWQWTTGIHLLVSYFP